MRSQRRWLCLAAALPAIGGCGDDASGDDGAPARADAARIDIVVDANRDGVVDPSDPADQAGEDSWTIEAGASFLANLDDDDGDRVRDADDVSLNGDYDLLDLARIRVAPWPSAPAGSRGIVGLDAESSRNVRLWKKGLDASWSLVAGATGRCGRGDACDYTASFDLSTDEVRAGVELGIEGRRFRASLDDPWSGMVDVTYRILDGQGARVTSDENPDGIDRVTMKVAPWVMFGNLSRFDRVWSSSVSGVFVEGVEAASTAAGVMYTRYAQSTWQDIWTQDFFQTAWTAIPAPGGGVHGMRVANARPWGRAAGEKFLPITWLLDNYLDTDQAVIEIYEKAGTGGTWDSHGNHDLIPPFTRGAQRFPLGRIIYGSNVLPETRAFYAAQEVQGPPISVRTSWLTVGHVDEFLSYAPAATPRGWKLLVASPRRMKALLEQVQRDGHGAERMFVGRKGYIGDEFTDFSRSVDATLSDATLLAWSQTAQADIDEAVDLLREEVGLAADEIVELPVFFEDIGGKVAWNPGMVNMLIMGDHAAVPKPFGPTIDGVDVIEREVQASLGSPTNALGRDGRGLWIVFIDDWDTYHNNLGEVHCGTNPEGPAPYSDVRWWEVQR